MTKQENIRAAGEDAVVAHGSIAVALAASQREMGKALKSAENPHFKSKYADLASVMDACLPALNRHGIAVIQPTDEGEHGRFVRTILIHGESGEKLECQVPLIVGKNDMQGYGSAVTYARRYGLMCMAGIAPEDDDGNAAAKSPPAKVQTHQRNQPDVKQDDALVAKMLEAIRQLGAKSLEADPKFKRDLEGLKARSPEAAARVTHEIAQWHDQQSASDLGETIDDEIKY